MALYRGVQFCYHSLNILLKMQFVYPILLIFTILSIEKLRHSSLAMVKMAKRKHPKLCGKISSELSVSYEKKDLNVIHLFTYK